MTKREFIVLKSKISEELKNISLLQEELSTRGLLDNNKIEVYFKDDNFKARAVGSILHDFYVVAENIFKNIAKEIDESVPTDSTWHISLLKQMSIEIKINELRPAVVTKQTAEKIDQYRSFRHV